MSPYEQDFEKLVRGLSIEDAPPPAHREELKRKVLRAFEQSGRPATDRPHQPRYWEGWKIIMTSRKVGLAAAVLAFVAVGSLVISLTIGQGATIALADVLAELEKAQTVCFTMTWDSPGTDPHVSRMMVLPPGRTRSEGPEMTTIIDWNQGEFLGFYTKEKMAFRSRIEEMDNYYYSNWLEDLKRIIGNEDAEELDQRQIDGRTVKGWRIRDEDDWLVTVWADVKTAELAQVDGHKGKFVMTMTNFEFDRPLDESLFSLEPPEGYFVGPKTVMKVSGLGAGDVAVLLNIWATGNGMKFPDNLNPWEFSRAASKVEWNKLDFEGSATELNDRISKAFAFLYGKPGWTYAGKGVKLGDAEAAVFWYRPDGSKEYRVIYGDLSVRDVPEEPSPSGEKQ